MANSKIESVEAENSKRRKDLIEAMDKANKAEEKLKELSEELKVKKMLVIQKDKEVQAALLRTDSEREKVIQNFKKSNHFSDLQFIQYYKGFELLCRWMMKNHNQAVDFSNLNFEAIDTKIHANEAREQEAVAATAVVDVTVVGEDTADDGRANVDKVIANPPYLNLFLFENNGCLFVLWLFIFLL